MDKPIVVVVTPAFNAEEFLDETIFNVISQRGNFRLRYHVQDGGSSDDTVNILRQWEERLMHGNPLVSTETVFSWQSAPDAGMYDGLNRAFSYVLSQSETGSTTNPILTWINADDNLLPNALQTASDYLAKNPQTEWITGMSSIMAASGTLANTWEIPKGFSQTALVAGEYDGRELPFVQQEGTFFRHSLWAIAGGVSQNFRLAGDWDLWRRFAVHAELIKLHCVLAVHRRHSGQLSDDMFSYYKEIDCAAHIDTLSLNLNENAFSAAYDINSGCWTTFEIASKDLRQQSPTYAHDHSKWERIDLMLTKLSAWVVSIGGLSFARSIKRMLRPGVGQLGIYPPRPVSLRPVQPSNQLREQALPRISIVVPSFNQGRFIGATLQSIIDQQYPNLELIVVDGGSTDNTLSVIKQYEAHLAWWVSEPDSGQTAAINKGFMWSTGEIMAWINSDDLVAPGAIHRVAAYLIKHPETQVVYGDRILINEDGLEIGRWILPRHSDRVLKWDDFVPQETLYWTRKAWNLIGGRLDETFRFAMDWDFLLRLSAKQINIRHLPVFLGLFRIHHQQKTSRQMSSIGQHEIRAIRRRELGFQPTRWQLILNTVPFLLAARFYELSLKLGLNRNTRT